LDIGYLYLLTLTLGTEQSDRDERPAFAEATAFQAWPVGWDHDLGGVFNGRAQREAAEIQRGSTINHPS